VVNLQPVDIAEVIFDGFYDQTPCRNGQSRSELPATSEAHLSTTKSDGIVHEGVAFTLSYEKSGLDHGVGHSLLLLYDAKTSHGQKIKEFKGLGHDPSNASISLF
jgi:hypothetical protein